MYVDGLLVVYIFFFQAEDGIRDAAVTGVQTCALPISFKSPRPTFRSRQSFLSSLEIRRQQSHALIDVVVQFSGNPRTFLFVSFNQSAAYARKGFLSQFTLGNVQNLPDKISRLAAGTSN